MAPIGLGWQLLLTQLEKPKLPVGVAPGSGVGKVGFMQLMSYTCVTADTLDGSSVVPGFSRSWGRSCRWSREELRLLASTSSKTCGTKPCEICKDP